MCADRVVAVYTYQAQRDDELSFTVDNIITVLDRSDSDWWRGQLHGRIGLFPSNYVAAREREYVNSEVSASSADQRVYMFFYFNKLRVFVLNS